VDGEFWAVSLRFHCVRLANNVACGEKVKRKKGRRVYRPKIEHLVAGIAGVLCVYVRCDVLLTIRPIFANLAAFWAWRGSFGQAGHVDINPTLATLYLDLLHRQRVKIQEFCPYGAYIS